MCIRDHHYGRVLDDRDHSHGGHCPAPCGHHALARGHWVKDSLQELPQGQSQILFRKTSLFIS